MSAQHPYCSVLQMLCLVASSDSKSPRVVNSIASNASSSSVTHSAILHASVDNQYKSAQYFMEEPQKLHSTLLDSTGCNSIMNHLKSHKGRCISKTLLPFRLRCNIFRLSQQMLFPFLFPKAGQDKIFSYYQWAFHEHPICS